MATIWPFAPNIWSDKPYVVTREYKTEIITSRSGREQRRAMRQTPRKRIEYRTTQPRECLTVFDRSMVTAQRTLLAIPDRVRFVRLTGGLPAGNSSVVINPVVPSWVVVGAELMLVDGSRHAIRTVTDVTGTTVTFAEFEATDWPTTTRLHPSLHGYLDANISAPLIWKRAVADVPVMFHVDPGSETTEDDGAAATTLGGREVFLTRPDRLEPIDLTRVQEGASSADYGFGRIARFFPFQFSTRMWGGSYTACDFDHADAIRQFFDRMKGRRGEFYMPTFQADLTPAAALTAAGTTLTVSGTETASVFNGSTVYAAIAVKKTDQTWLCRTVSSITPSGGNSVIAVAAPWGANVALADIEMVCWLPVWRFASDILTISWPREDIANIQMPMQMLENLAVES